MLLKICGLTGLTDLRAAEAVGADYLGVILVPGTPRAVSVEKAEQLIGGASRPTVCVVRDVPIEKLNAIIRKLHPNIVQLHGNESREYASKIQGAIVWKAVTLDSETALQDAATFPCAMIVADSGGGTGTPCRWNLAKTLAQMRPVMLAGGITPENVRDAIRQVSPAGIDVSGGVEKYKGIKDHDKMELLAERIRE